MNEVSSFVIFLLFLCIICNSCICNHWKVLQLVSELSLLVYKNTMAESTQIQGLDEWLDIPENRVQEIMTVINQSRNEVGYCQVCASLWCLLKNQSGNSLPGGLLHPLPISTQVWEDISMNFIEGLPKSGDKECIMVVIDRLTKVGHFLPLSHPYMAITVAHIFFDHNFKLHGLPKNNCDSQR